MNANSALNDAMALANIRSRFCATVYGPLIDWWPPGPPTAGARIAAMRVEHQLRAEGASEPVATQFADRVLTAPEALDRDQPPGAEGLGIFATEDAIHVRLLATAPVPTAVLSDRFLIGPLVESTLRSTTATFVLALSENHVRLVDVTPPDARPLVVAGLPRSLEAVEPLDVTGDRDTWAHLQVSERPKERLRSYSRAIDKAIVHATREQHPLLVLAAAEPLLSIFREVTSYDRVTDTALRGNHDDDSPEQLAHLAAPIIEEFWNETAREQLQRLAALSPRGLAVDELRRVVKACRAGAVDTLLVDVNRREPIPSEAFDVATTEDLVDEAVRGALMTGAAVVAVDSAQLPHDGPAAAILRYPWDQLMAEGSAVP